MSVLNAAGRLHIRSMQESDIQEVHAIDMASFPAPWPAGSYKYEVLENKSSICLVAESRPEGENPAVVGMVVAWMILDEAHIATIAVHPDYRRQGIGRLLLGSVLKDAIGKGATSAALEVRSGNLAAQELYREFGFGVVGRRPGYYKDNSEDAVLMSVYDLDQDYLEWIADDGEESPVEQRKDRRQADCS